MSTNTIVQIYVKLVRAGVRTIETVPVNIRDEVAAELNEEVTI
ncbi:hypothetical protein PghCCS26_47920 [Paenibacillus glycanilyticus]|uniref:Uncharacterized protein n=1 Tax=Paenibacillus glycanilyticus TaxID=126569 RepID=A0ABQ6NTW1_9BACL|nr:CD1375 family protein [Paenibacillus glycanilyticus]GMK47662.1 hypothetical protein PghCCS26_47920 [Paenibacillus glycanilyticus]